MYNQPQNDYKLPLLILIVGLALLLTGLSINLIRMNADGANANSQTVAENYINQSPTANPSRTFADIMAEETRTGVSTGAGNEVEENNTPVATYTPPTSPYTYTNPAPQVLGASSQPPTLPDTAIFFEGEEKLALGFVLLLIGVWAIKISSPQLKQKYSN
jgi:hypothetical protein